MKKAKLLLIACSIFAATEVWSQNKAAATGRHTTYRSGIGLRLGWEGGLSFKHFIKETHAIEGILSTGWGYGGFKLTGLYEVQKPLSDVEGLDWFFGGGIHIGTYPARYFGYYGWSGSGYYDSRGNWHPNGYRSRYMVVGIDGILGLEYQFEDLPFTATLDIKPYINFVGWNNRFSDGALTLRYIF